MSKQPAFQFYPGDWLKDANLRRCSPAARGVWMDILCLMFDSDERGVLRWADAEVADAIAGPADVVLACIKELETKCVLSRLEDGAMMSRRMVRDEEIRRVRAVAGSKGGSKTAAKPQAKVEQIPEVEDVDEEESAREGIQEGQEKCAPNSADFVDWLVQESLFVSLWNGTEGVARISRNEIPPNLTRTFRERYLELGWLNNAKRALTKFPLKSGVRLSIDKFLQPTTVDNILGGVYDFDRNDRGAGKTRRRTGQVHADESGQPAQGRF